MSRPAARKLAFTPTLCVLVAALLLLAGLLALHRAAADQLPSRLFELSQGIPGVVDTYQVGFTMKNAETLGSVDVKICAEGPLFGTPCTPPPGLDMSGATLGNQTGVTDFSILSATTNEVILSHTAGPTPAGQQVSFELENITNPSLPGSYFGRIQTFASQDGTGPNNDFGGVAYALNSPVQVSATVPPYLYFCVGVSITGTDCTTATGDYINLGNFSTAIASVASSQMVAGSNADTGYNIVASGTTLTSGNNTIPPIVSPDTSRPGTSQFGINLVANQDPQVGQNPSGQGNGQPVGGYDQPNLYKFAPGDTVVTVPLPDAPRNYTVSYIANIAKSQAAGVYVSTMTYIATGNF